MESNALITVGTIDASSSVEVKERSLTILDVAQSLEITDQEVYEQAATTLGQVKKLLKEVTVKRKDITDPITLAKSKVMDLFRPGVEALEAAIKITDKKVSAYAIKLENEAEAERVKAEQKQEKETERLRKKAESMKTPEKKAEYEQKAEEAQNFTPPTPVHVAPKGQGFRTYYSVEVVDFSKVPDTFKMFNQSAANKNVTSTEGKVAIPGCKIISEKRSVNR